MLEKEQPPTAEVVKHIDRCLSCLACMTTCPSGVHYMHLVDQARVRIEEQYTRPPAERWLRRVLAWVLPNPKLFRLSMVLAPARPATADAVADAAGRSDRADADEPAARDADAGAGRPAAAGPEGGVGVRGDRPAPRPRPPCCKAAPSRCWRRESTTPPSPY